jgi:DinB superfamily
MIRLKLAVDQLLCARNYTLDLLDTIDTVDWYQTPAQHTTHVGWQVGHLAVAEYRLALVRIRGAQPGDEKLIPPDYLRLFGKNSIPSSKPGDYPGPDELRATLDRVHVAALNCMQNLPVEELDMPLTEPHRVAKTKLEALLFCGQHEMVHAGQIGLLRRMSGYAPVW